MKLLKRSFIPFCLGVALIFASTAQAGLPNPGLKINRHTALVIVDPQNDFLSPKGVAWGAVGKSVEQNHTVRHLGQLMKAAKHHGMLVFISPHYYYPTDAGWKHGGSIEVLMHNTKMFSREGTLSLRGFENSGADWQKNLKPYIQDGKTIIASPHKVYGPESNDLMLQLRKRGINKVILAGMSANLCVESHLRDLLEEGFEVAVVKDATAGAILPEGNGYQAALTNFRMIANAVWSTNETIRKIDQLPRTRQQPQDQA